MGHSVINLQDMLSRPSLEAAKLLLGSRIERTIGNEKLAGIIVETEAYDQDDAASHSYRGMTERNRIMFGPSGHAYVYFTYGMHYCFNIVTGAKGRGCGVLIRAIEPIAGIETMLRHRGRTPLGNLTNGPAKLCQALAIDKSLNGHDLREPPLRLLPGESIDESSIVQTTRIGIRQAVHEPWRFFIRGNEHVSKPESTPRGT